MHPEGAPLGAQHVAHFLQDGVGGIVELDDRSQRLADGVEEVDLLVALRQLVREEMDLLGEVQRSFEVPLKDGSQRLEP